MENTLFEICERLKDYSSSKVRFDVTFASKDKDGNFVLVVHPVDSEVRNESHE